MDQPTPRASFGSLSVEIKTYIVRLARLQDVAFSTREALLYRQERNAFLPRELKWHGRSTNALFMVNKELSALAAAHLFEVGWRCLQLWRLGV